MKLNGRLLVAEPGDHQRDALASLLEARGIPCLLARDASEALELLAAEPIEVAIVEYDLVEWEPALRARLEAAKIRVLWITARGAADLPPGLEVLRKPLDVDALLALISLQVD